MTPHQNIVQVTEAELWVLLRLARKALPADERRRRAGRETQMEFFVPDYGKGDPRRVLDAVSLKLVAAEARRRAATENRYPEHEGRRRKDNAMR